MCELELGILNRYRYEPLVPAAVPADTEGVRVVMRLKDAWK
jgi:hypothetical protein